MNQDVPPSPESDPQRLSLESLEQQLRALPPARVPDSLPSKLIAAIPPYKAAGSLANSALQHWPWIAGAALICMTMSAAFYVLHSHWNSNPATGADRTGNPTASATAEDKRPASSKAIEQYEQAIRFDPYNANAWFSLAKAQADVHRSSDAISSAQKAIDIARSRNRSDVAATVEAWLRSYHAAQPIQSSP